jgi:AraC-like DNA-binding protein
MARSTEGPAREAATYWRHPVFHDLGLLRARFTRHRYDRHTHPTYVVALITAGCERIRIGRHDVLAPAGTVAVVNPEEWHDGEKGAEDGWAYRTLYPPVALLTAIARDLGRDRAPVFPRLIAGDRALVRALALAHAASMSGDRVHAEESLLRALRRLVEAHAEWERRRAAPEAAGSRRRFAVYADLVERGMDAPIDLRRLAEAGGVTRFQVIRDFRKTLGVTPALYLRDRRLRRAVFLIQQGLGLAEAAAAAGFADQSHLSRSFRAAHGVTPGEFRKSRSSLR